MLHLHRITDTAAHDRIAAIDNPIDHHDRDIPDGPFVMLRSYGAIHDNGL